MSIGPKAAHDYNMAGTTVFPNNFIEFCNGYFYYLLFELCWDEI